MDYFGYNTGTESFKSYPRPREWLHLVDCPKANLGDILKQQTKCKQSGHQLCSNKFVLAVIWKGTFKKIDQFSTTDLWFSDPSPSTLPTSYSHYVSKLPDGRIMCSLCHKTWESRQKSTALAHIQRRHFEINVCFACPHCPHKKPFSTRSNLRTHLAKLHGVKMTESKMDPFMREKDTATEPRLWSKESTINIIIWPMTYKRTLFKMCLIVSAISDQCSAMKT